MAWMFSPTGIVIIAVLIVVMASLIYWRRKSIKKWLASRKVGVTIKAGPVEVSLAEPEPPSAAWLAVTSVVARRPPSRPVARPPAWILAKRASSARRRSRT